MFVEKRVKKKKLFPLNGNWWNTLLTSKNIYIECRCYFMFFFINKTQGHSTLYWKCYQRRNLVCCQSLQSHTGKPPRNMYISSNQDWGLDEGRGWVFQWKVVWSGVQLIQSRHHNQPWEYSTHAFWDGSFLLCFHNMDRMHIYWDWSQSAQLLIMYCNTASLHYFWFSKANYGSQKWIVIPTNCWQPL